MDRLIEKIATFLSLFSSLGTLLCCALPVTLVSIGMGATFASLTSSFPQIVWLTEKKNELFILTAILLIISFLMLKRSEKLVCPVDVEQAELCHESKGASKKIFWFSVIIYFIGLLFSYIMPGFLYGL